MKKRFFLFVTMLFFALTLTAHASYMANLSDLILSFSGTTAYCSVVCNGDNGTDSISATLTLYQGSTQIDSWSDSGSFSVPVSGSCNVTSGLTYRLKLSWSVNGVSQPDVEVSNTCP